MKYRCPKCRKMLPDVLPTDTEDKKADVSFPEFFPFCSQRCKLLDFGAWIDEDYRICQNPDETEDPTESDMSES